MTTTPTPQEMAEACRVALVASEMRVSLETEWVLDALPHAAAYIEQAAAREARLRELVAKKLAGCGCVPGGSAECLTCAWMSEDADDLERALDGRQ